MGRWRNVILTLRYYGQVIYKKFPQLMTNVLLNFNLKAIRDGNVYCDIEKGQQMLYLRMFA